MNKMIVGPSGPVIVKYNSTKKSSTILQLVWINVGINRPAIIMCSIFIFWGPEWCCGLKALHLNARGITTDTPGSNPGHDWESHRAAHNWPTVVQVCPVLAVIEK